MGRRSCGLALTAAIVVGWALACGPSDTTGATSDHSTAPLQAVLDRAVNEGVPGAVFTEGSPGALAQIRRDGTTEDLGAGVANRDTGEAPSSAMHFRAGSITKTFLATVVLQLSDEDVLHLDDTVERWLPGLVQGNGNDGSKISLQMLLDHTSGLFNYAGDEDLNARFEADPLQGFSLRELVQVATSYPPVFEPGAGWFYSDTDYVLLALVVEQATGESYADAITARILAPLDLEETYFPRGSPNLRAPHMSGYTLSDASGSIEIVDVTEYNPSFAAGSGDIVSTASDLDRFLEALLQGELLAGDTLDGMLRPTPGSNVFPSLGTYAYGQGILIGQLPCGVTVYGSAGTIAGSLSWVGGARDGATTFSFDLNGDWVDQPKITDDANRAVFCP